MKKIYPFQKTVFRLGEIYYKATRQRLGFYPVSVHESHKVRIGTPIMFNPLSQPVRERLGLKRMLESAVNQQYLGLDREFRPEKMMTHY